MQFSWTRTSLLLNYLLCLTWYEYYPKTFKNKEILSILVKPSKHCSHFRSNNLIMIAGTNLVGPVKYLLKMKKIVLSNSERPIAIGQVVMDHTCSSPKRFCS